MRISARSCSIRIAGAVCIYTEGIASYRHAALIYNPFAGKLAGRHESLIRPLLDDLRTQGIDAEPRPTTGPRTAAALARQAIDGGADLILAAGGDGTINEVANGMVGSSVPLAILPAGTANVLAVEMGLKGGVRRAVERLPALVNQRIAVGAIEPPGGERRHFLLMAGFGLDAHIVANVSPGFKNRFGKVAYWIAGFSQLGQTFPEFEVTLDGVPHRASFALLSRVKNYGGDLEIARGASLLKPAFEAVLFSGSNSFRYLPYFAGVLVGRLNSFRGVTIAEAREVEMRSLGGQPVLAQIDGETAGAIPARVEIVPEALHLLVPAEFQAKLQAEAARSAVRGAGAWTTSPTP